MKEKRKKINMKRVLTTLIGFPIIACLLIFSNNLVMDITVAIISIISIFEYNKCFKMSKKANPSMWIGIAISLLIIFTHIISDIALKEIILVLLPLAILSLFIELLFSNGKKNVRDIAVTLLGVLYIPMMLLFLSLIKGNFVHGNILIWYVFFAAWGSDVFAYLIGKNFGKHKYTSISPNKTIEGCISGIIGAVIISIIYTIIINICFNLGISYIMVGIIAFILSIIGQIGDLAASSIKRYCGIKDFSDLIPGHGGMLDRIDSVIFIAPFAYILLGLII